jgi:hypothetical protein
VSDYEPQFEQRSSVEISRTAKGDATWKVKVYADATQAQVEAARKLALDQYRDLEAELA